MVNANVSVMGSIEMSVNIGKWVGMEGIIAMIKYTRTIFLLFLIVKDKRLNSNEHSIKRTVCLQNKTRLYFVIFIKLILLSFCSIFTTENLSLKVQRIVIIGREMQEKNKSYIIFFEKMRGFFVCFVFR